MKIRVCLLAAVMTTIGLSVALVRAQEKKEPAQDKRNVWMKQKLKLSQDILAGLTEADFDKVTAGAKALNASGYLEKWIDRGKPQHDKYELQRANFEHYNRQLIELARDKNMEGAALAYHFLTASCIECHKVVRDVKK